MNRLMLVLGFLLSGCAVHQLTDDMINNKFFEHTPIAIEFGGFYSATMGPYILTYKIANDGTGLSCYYQNGTVVVHKMKVFSRNDNAYGVILETGTTSVIRLLGNDTYSLESYGEKYKLLPDNALTLSNLSCKNNLVWSTPNALNANLGRLTRTLAR